jgi:ribose transport system substrate-binding protein
MFGRTMVNRRPGVVLAASAALLVAGCGTAAGSGTGTGTVDSASTRACVTAADKYVKAYEQPATALPPGFTPLSAKPKPGGKVIKIYNALIPSDQLGFEATQVAARTVGWTAQGISFDGTLPDFTAKFSQAIAEKPAAIMSAGQEPASIPGLIAKAKADGILVEMNSTVAAPTSEPGFGAEVLGPQAQALNGEIAANWLMADSKCAGSVLIVNLAGFPILKVTTDRMQKVLKADCADCSAEYIEVAPADLGTAQGTGSIVAALQSAPKIKYVFLNNGGLDTGLTTALLQANLSGIKIFGAAPNQGAIADLKNGTNAMWAGESSVVLAWAAFDSVLRALETGKPVNEPAVPGIGIFTKANVGQVATIPDYPTNYQQLFKAVWKVG